jgi:hypothetical protein
MHEVRPLLVALLLVSGVLIGFWSGTGSGQGTAPPRPATPSDAVQQAQTSQAVPITRPGQRKTPHDQQVPARPLPRPPRRTRNRTRGRGSASTLRATRSTRSAHADGRGDHAGRHCREAGGDGRTAPAPRIPLRLDAAPGSCHQDVDEPRRGRSRPSRCAGSRTARRIFTTAGCSRSRTRWNSSTWSSR